MLYTRYHTAFQFSAGKDVLEVGCGAGHGLGYLARTAHRVVGGDYTENLLRCAQRYYQGRVPLVRLDAHHLPFQDASFDTVILFEAIYYLAAPDKFLDECHRILRPNGVLLICSANKDWSGFSPSALSTRYFSVRELHTLLSGKAFRAELFGAFPVAATSNWGRLVLLIRAVAVSLHLIPRTMRGKELLKRVFYGLLAEIKPEIEDGMAELAPLVPIPRDSATSTYKVIFAIARAE
ncbi:class I SAM-dependent methyltransferase [Acidobacteriia bacterium AH_259_A11_L15]|nr:class I SAM-dependent methyltransferase [Acidobacteriia bacterium AH_259_A11_L15]